MFKTAAQFLFCASAVSAAATSKSSDEQLTLWMKGCVIGNSDTRHVDISTADAAPADSSMSVLTASYGTVSTYELKNIGSSWQIKLNAEDQAKNTVTGGPLGDATYVLSSVYSNWGKTGDEGSDHSFDGEAQLGEIHFVHHSDEYDSIEDAIKSGDSDAIAVVSVMLQKGDGEEPPAYVDLLEVIGGESDAELNLDALLPASLAQSAPTSRAFITADAADALPALRKKEQTETSVTRFEDDDQIFYTYKAALPGTETFCTKSIRIVMSADADNGVAVTNTEGTPVTIVA